MKRFPIYYLLTFGGVFSAMLSIGGSVGYGRCVSTSGTMHVDTFIIAPVDTLRGSTESDYFQALFIEAIRQRHLGNDDVTLQLVERCREMRPDAAEVYYLLYDYYNEKKDTSEALHYIRRAAAIDTENADYLQSLASALLKAEQYEACIPVLEKIVSIKRSDSDVLKALFSLYKMVDNADQSLATLNRLEAIEGSQLDLTLHKMNLLEAQGKPDAAFDEMKKLITDHPYDYNLQVLAGNWLIGHGKAEEAFVYYTTVLDDDPDNEDALLALIDYYEETGQTVEADSVRDRMVFSKKINSDTRVKLVNQNIILNLQNGQDSTVTLEYLERVVDSDPGNVELRRQLAAYMQFIKVDNELLQRQLDEILRLDATDVWARVVTMQNKWSQKKYKEVIQTATEGTQYVPEEMTFYYFLGLALFHEGDHEQALDALQRGTTQINENSNEEFVADFYGMMGDIYHEKHLYNKAFEAYDSCLRWQPENVGCLNNYAYYLCLKGKDLDKAEVMSAKTIAKEPNNAVFLDTYAWVLFCQGRYEEAIPYIEHALKSTTDTSGIYYEHAGDIYAMCGQTDKAVELWKQAAQINTADKTLKKKIKRKQYIKP